jgi:hypothetical protein
MQLKIFGFGIKSHGVSSQITFGDCDYRQLFHVFVSFMLCTIFFVFARFLCFWFFFLCLGLDSRAFVSELCLGANIGVHNNHHKMENIILIHIPNLLLGFNI